jgi:hypothetical protein
VFSGPEKSADDIIARDVRWLQETLRCDVCVVTEDLLLRRRCRTASTTSRTSKKRNDKDRKKDKQKAKKEKPGGGSPYQKLAARRRLAAGEGEEDNDSDRDIDSINSVYTAPPDPVSSIRVKPALGSLELRIVNSKTFVASLYGEPDRPNALLLEKYAKYHDDRKVNNTSTAAPYSFSEESISTAAQLVNLMRQEVFCVFLFCCLFAFYVTNQFSTRLVFVNRWEVSSAL